MKISEKTKKILNHIKENTTDEITTHFNEIYNAVKPSAIKLKYIIDEMKTIEKSSIKTNHFITKSNG